MGRDSGLFVNGIFSGPYLKSTKKVILIEKILEIAKIIIDIKRRRHIITLEYNMGCS